MRGNDCTAESGTFAVEMSQHIKTVQVSILSNQQQQQQQRSPQR